MISLLLYVVYEVYGFTSHLLNCDGKPLGLMDEYDRHFGRDIDLKICIILL